MALAIDQAHPGVLGKTQAPERPKDRYDRLFEGSDQEQSWRM
jgi:hypothetical protein